MSDCTSAQAGNISFTDVDVDDGQAPESAFSLRPSAFGSARHCILAVPWQIGGNLSWAEPADISQVQGTVWHDNMAWLLVP